MKPIINALLVIFTLSVLATLATYALSQWTAYQIKPLSDRKLKKLLAKESEFFAKGLALYLEAGIDRVATREVLRNVRDIEKAHLENIKHERLPARCANSEKN